MNEILDYEIFIHSLDWSNIMVSEINGNPRKSKVGHCSHITHSLTLLCMRIYSLVTSNANTIVLLSSHIYNIVSDILRITSFRDVFRCFIDSYSKLSYTFRFSRVNKCICSPSTQNVVVIFEIAALYSHLSKVTFYV